jgi:hypothetical protein
MGEGPTVSAGESLSPLQFNSGGMAEVHDPETAYKSYHDMRTVIGNRIPPWENHAEVSHELLDPGDLTPTQPDLWKQNWERMNEPGSTAHYTPVKVIRAGGQNYLHDGHHRLRQAQEQGRKVEAVVWDPKY